MYYDRDKISDVIAVLTIIEKEYKKSLYIGNIRNFRILATEVIAEKEFKNKRFLNPRSAKNTIHDAMARRLRPDIKNIKEFDKLTTAWLSKGSVELKDTLQGHSNDRVEKSQLDTFFC